MRHNFTRTRAFLVRSAQNKQRMSTLVPFVCFFPHACPRGSHTREMLFFPRERKTTFCEARPLAGRSSFIPNYAYNARQESALGPKTCLFAFRHTHALTQEIIFSEKVVLRRLFARAQRGDALAGMESICDEIFRAPLDLLQNAWQWQRAFLLYCSFSILMRAARIPRSISSSYNSIKLFLIPHPLGLINFESPFTARQNPAHTHSQRDFLFMAVHIKIAQHHPFQPTALRSNQKPIRLLSTAHFAFNRPNSSFLAKST